MEPTKARITMGDLTASVHASSVCEYGSKLPIDVRLEIQDALVEAAVDALRPVVIGMLAHRLIHGNRRPGSSLVTFMNEAVKVKLQGYITFEVSINVNVRGGLLQQVISDSLWPVIAKVRSAIITEYDSSVTRTIMVQAKSSAAPLVTGDEETDERNALLLSIPFTPRAIADTIRPFPLEPLLKTS